MSWQAFLIQSALVQLRKQNGFDHLCHQQRLLQNLGKYLANAAPIVALAPGYALHLTKLKYVNGGRGLYADSCHRAALNHDCSDKTPQQWLRFQNLGLIVLRLQGSDLLIEVYTMPRRFQR